MTVPNLIIDSSVAAKWFFPEELDSAYALKIKDNFLNRKIIISVPNLIFYEVSNLLKTAIIRLRINKDRAIKAYEGFLELNFTVYSTSDLLKNGLKKSIDLDISSYDASYLTLSEFLKIPFYTSDQALIKRSDSKLIKSLARYEK